MTDSPENTHAHLAPANTAPTHRGDSPPSAPWPAFDAAQAARIIETGAAEEGALLETMIRLQARFGCVPAEALPMLAEAFNLSRAEVYGVKSFYHDLRDAPPGPYVLKQCRAEACQAAGAAAVETHLKTRHGLRDHETDGRSGITMEPVYCLGNCALGPNLMINEDVHGRLTPERIDGLITRLKNGGRS
ncbi:NAD(P)H-dependent oxidoreductase subunit E [Yunchengibacter salinarum]|uniref:NAD(P)H-dependent oxidoreductase subunit E n=1 Tax=Yunchengibacter salinarum TaxID=3133399 RepID=UPI0035B597E9